MSFPPTSSIRSLHTGLITCIGIAVLGCLNPVFGQSINLSTTPPTVTTQVQPNIVVTFDDSGSMVWTRMGDDPPYGTSKDWSDGPWRCANVIDPTAAAFLSDGVTRNPAAGPMNGVYYNPNITYVPPIGETGISFPPADATLRAVWVDGIAVNRPVGAVSPTTAATTYNNPDSNGSASDAGRANLMGTTSTTRWQCGTGSTTTDNWTGANPFTSSPNGGPYYYRYTGPTLATTTNGALTTTSLNNLYTVGNWTSVSVPAVQYQNFANWYAYYRTRTLMARTSLSRVFAAVTNPIRVAWQNLGNNSINGKTYNLPTSTIITTLDDNSTDPVTTPIKYRAAFFNWIFATPADNGTPSRGATIRVGQFFKRGNGNTGTTVDLTDPYYQPAAAGQAHGAELACRQNFHMLVTDGLYNGDSPAASSYMKTSVTQTLPANSSLITTYPTPAAGTSNSGIYKGFDTTVDGYATLSNIAFTYWATNLRPDLVTVVAPYPVPPYFPDTTTGVTATATTPVITDVTNGTTPEIFWNPVNDPATWPHLVQFMVTLGAFGNLTYSDDIDCTKGSPAGNDDLCKLRKSLANSSGASTWPRPGTSGGNDLPANIDDLWHAALNSRGAFFVATDPQSLVTHLTTILNNIAARASNTTAATTNTGVLSQGSLSYKSGFFTGDWSGSLTAYKLDSTTGAASLTGSWDAGCLLTAPPCKVSNLGPPVAPSTSQTGPPATRQILMAKGIGSSPSIGTGFAWSNLTVAQQAFLNTDTSVATPVTDANGQLRLNYLRGDQSHEITGSTPLFRTRPSVLGAIINSQPDYVSFPDSGYNDDFPPASPTCLAGSACSAESTAAALLVVNGTTGVATEPTVDGTTYEQFVKNHQHRQPTLYVGSNDGMLHAFNANTGVELFGFIPYTVFPNLNRFMPSNNFSFTNYVDNTSIHRDVFSTVDHKWHTLLVGTLRLGGRGVFALDITDPTAITETSAATSVLWEYNNTSAHGADLGYTYGLPNIARTNYGWVVIVPSGNFPNCPGSPTIPNCTTSSNTTSSFYVLDAMTGAYLSEIKTPGGVISFGLSSVTVGGSQGTEIEQVAFAGDLVGNMFRLNMSDANPTAWTVDLIFKTYTSGSTCPTTPVTNGPCSQPITSAPTLFPSALNASGYMVVFGTGQYLNPTDATTTLAQAFYGITDFGATTSSPVNNNSTDLVTQTLTVDSGAAGLRELTNLPVTAPKKGWKIPLTPIAGERALVSPGALFNTNSAILGTFTPSVDPCSTTTIGGIMLVNAETGGPAGPALYAGGSGSSTTTVVGETVINAPATGSLPMVQAGGGGAIILPGIIGPIAGKPISLPAPIWRRRAWRMLFNDL